MLPCLIYFWAGLGFMVEHERFGISRLMIHEPWCMMMFTILQSEK
jgi:hypothetical protein